MKTKYIKVPISENRLPKDFTEVLVQYKNQKDFKEYSFFDSLHCKDEMIKAMDFWLEEVPDREEEMRKMLERCLESFKYIHANASFAFHDSNTDDHIEHLPYRMQELEQLLNELKQTT